MSGLIPQPFIDDLLNRTDLVELIDGYVPLKKEATVILRVALSIMRKHHHSMSLQKNNFIIVLVAALQVTPSVL